MSHYVCFTGGRDLHTPDAEAALTDIIRFLAMFYGVGLRVMHGGAKGIDQLADRICGCVDERLGLDGQLSNWIRLPDGDGRQVASRKWAARAPACARLRPHVGFDGRRW